jgi:hypothetical protein
MNNSNFQKMIFAIKPGMWHGSATESVWVSPLGSSLYKLENSPFFVFDVSFQDVLIGKYDGDSLIFDSVSSRGGHSTYRIIKIKKDIESFLAYWSPLQKIGCTFEEGLNDLLSVDVPPETDIQVAYSKLEQAERKGVWSFEEAHCGHMQKSEDSANRDQ